MKIYLYNKKLLKVYVIILTVLLTLFYTFSMEFEFMMVKSYNTNRYPHLGTKPV